MKERLIENINPQPEIRRNAESGDWEYAEEARYLYEKAIVFRERFLDPIARIDRRQLPDPIIGVENLRNYKVLAEYLVNRDAVGLNFRLNFNEEHYIEKDGKKWRFGRWAQLETLLHEYIHGWQQTVGFGKEPYKPGKSKSAHNKEFTRKCEELGLHVLPEIGCHMKVADEPFSILMREWGIERPGDVPTDDRVKIDWFKIAIDWKRGVSSLTKYTCPNCGLNVRVGIKSDPELIHKPCGSVLIKADGIAHTLYESPEIAQRKDLEVR